MPYAGLLSHSTVCVGVTVQGRGELRHRMLQTLKSRHKQLPNFITMKWVKFFVLVARADWPQDYTDFFEQIYESIQSQEYSYLGLTFLLISSEELANPRLLQRMFILDTLLT